MIRIEEASRWLLDEALPFWAEAGVDRHFGGFVEQLDLSGRDRAVAFKRMRTQCRQIYCFTHAAMLGWRRGAEIADHGWDFLVANGRRGDGGWVRRIGRAGGALDPTCDAYDMAFVLFAHAWRFRLTRDAAVLDSALHTLDVLDRLLKHPDEKGWIAHEGATGSRAQNPHMHLAEAAIELADSTGDVRCTAMAAELLRLLRDRMLGGGREELREQYREDWSLDDTPAGRSVEPGHMFEWVWILVRAERLLGLECGGLPLRLYLAAERMGVSQETGLVYDQIDPDGAILSGGSRTWPQTERLKGALAVLERYGRDTRPAIADSVDILLDRYLAAPLRGGWIDRFDEQGRPQADHIPASTFYHLVLAISELLRLRSVIETSDR